MLVFICDTDRASFTVRYFDQKKEESFSVHPSEILHAMYKQFFKKMISYHFDGHIILQDIDLALPLSKQKVSLLPKKAIFVGFGFDKSPIQTDSYSMVLTKFFKSVFALKYEVCLIFDFRNFEDYDIFVKPSRLKVCGKTHEGKLICYEIHRDCCLFYQFEKKLKLVIK